MVWTSGAGRPHDAGFAPLRYRRAAGPGRDDRSDGRFRDGPSGRPDPGRHRRRHTRAQWHGLRHEQSRRWCLEYPEHEGRRPVQGRRHDDRVRRLHRDRRLPGSRSGPSSELPTGSAGGRSRRAGRRGRRAHGPERRPNRRRHLHLGGADRAIARPAAHLQRPRPRRSESRREHGVRRKELALQQHLAGRLLLQQRVRTGRPGPGGTDGFGADSLHGDRAGERAGGSVRHPSGRLHGRQRQHRLEEWHQRMEGRRVRSAGRS